MATRGIIKLASKTSVLETASNEALFFASGVTCFNSIPLVMTVKTKGYQSSDTIYFSKPGMYLSAGYIMSNQNAIIRIPLNIPYEMNDSNATQTYQITTDSPWGLGVNNIVVELWGFKF